MLKTYDPYVDTMSVKIVDDTHASLLISGIDAREYEDGNLVMYMFGKYQNKIPLSFHRFFEWLYTEFKKWEPYIIKMAQEFDEIYETREYEFASLNKSITLFKDWDRKGKFEGNPKIQSLFVYTFSIERFLCIMENNLHEYNLSDSNFEHALGIIHFVEIYEYVSPKLLQRINHSFNRLSS